MKKFFKAVSFSFISLLVVSACNSSKPDSSNTLRFGIIPFESAEELIKNINPMLEVIGEGMGMEIKPYISADYTGVVEAFRNNRLDAAFLSPASYVMARKEAGVKVILKSQRGGNPYYYGAIITRKDSGINDVKDLKGKSFAFGDPLSTSGHVFPKMIMLKNNINPETDFKNVLFSGAHDATVLAVLNKKVDAGSTFSDDHSGSKGSWTRYLKPEEVEQLKVIAVTEPIPADNIVVSKELEPETAEKLADVIIDFGKTKEGNELMKKLYKFDGYMKATDQDYDSVREAFELSGIHLEESLKKKE